VDPVLLLVIVLGVVAGSTTTIAGAGGGVVLTLALAPILGPHAALAVTALPLVLGNAHRAITFRAHIDRRIVGAIAVGIVPGVVAGALLVNALSERQVHILLGAALALAILRELGWLRLRPRSSVLVPGGFTLGFTSAAAGGGGLVAGPLVLATGLRGKALVAAIAAIGVVVNASRVVAYGAGGMLELAHLPVVLVLAASILAGNVVGERVRGHLSDRGLHATTWLVMLACLGLTIAGVA
jgi:uncharacterized membrane protein YfcA